MRLCVKQNAQRVARSLFEGLEQSIIDRRVCAFDAEIDFCAGCDTDESAGNGCLIAVFHAAHQTLDDDVIVLKANRSLHIDKRIRELRVGSGSPVEPKQTCGSHRCSNAVCAGCCARDGGAQIECPGRYVEVGENLRGRLRQLKHVWAVGPNLWRTEVRDTNRHGERRTRGGLLKPRFSRFPVKRRERGAWHMKLKFTLEGERDHARGVVARA